MHTIRSSNNTPSPKRIPELGDDVDNFDWSSQNQNNNPTEINLHSNQQIRTPTLHRQIRSERQIKFLEATLRHIKEMTDDEFQQIKTPAAQKIFLDNIAEEIRTSSYCNFCHKLGHSTDECRTKSKRENKLTAYKFLNTSEPQSCKRPKYHKVCTRRDDLDHTEIIKLSPDTPAETTKDALLLQQMQ